MWVTTGNRIDKPAKYLPLLAVYFLFGLMFVFGTNPEKMRWEPLINSPF